jgi:uncharacterized protein
MLSLRSAPILVAALSLALVQPAFADVKAGVDAWSKGDFAGAIGQWRDAAAKGDADAQFNMAQAYKLGRGVKQDLDIAADWYQRAAKQGHLQAADSLGHLHHYQNKVAAALPLLETSSQRGEPRSQYLLATELFNGVHIGKDWVRAYALMTRASSSGLVPASRSLAEMDKHIPLDQRQQAIAMAAEIERSSAQVRAAQVGGFDINTKPPIAVARKVDVPTSAPPAKSPGFPGSIPPIEGNSRPAVATKSAPPPKPAKVAVATPAKPTPAPAAAPLPAATNTVGKWRIQLGAFSNAANANRLWSGLAPKVSGLSALNRQLSTSGSVTRLQAGPLANRAAAEAMCTKVKAAASGQACIVVVP